MSLVELPQMLPDSVQLLSPGAELVVQLLPELAVWYRLPSFALIQRSVELTPQIPLMAPKEGLVIAPQLAPVQRLIIPVSPAAQASLVLKAITVLKLAPGFGEGLISLQALPL